MSSDQTPAVTKKTLPTLQELHHDTGIAFKNDQLNLLLNQDVPATWIKKNPFAGNTQYIAIEKVEFLLTRIFQRFRIEILREGQLFNSVYVTVRVHYIDPVTGEWDFHDGTGAVGIQTDAGKAASDLNAIKQNAVQMALPAAVSYAIKDACEHFGKLFGRDLNRKETLPFSGAYATPDKINETAKAIKDAKQ